MYLAAFLASYSAENRRQLRVNSSRCSLWRTYHDEQVWLTSQVVGLREQEGFLVTIPFGRNLIVLHPVQESVPGLEDAGHRIADTAANFQGTTHKQLGCLRSEVFQLLSELGGSLTKLVSWHAILVSLCHAHRRLHCPDTCLSTAVRLRELHAQLSCQYASFARQLTAGIDPPRPDHGDNRSAYGYR